MPEIVQEKCGGVHACTEPLVEEDSGGLGGGH